MARETLDRALAYAFGGRKLKKRDYRSLWIARINAGVTAQGISYSRFIAALKSLHIELDRRVLADLAYNDSKSFAKLTDMAKGVESKRQATLKQAHKSVAQKAA